MDALLSPELRDRARACLVGAALGDTLGMPLEFRSPRFGDQQVRHLAPGRLPAGHFTNALIRGLHSQAGQERPDDERQVVSQQTCGHPGNQPR
jgi:hypothetical protein